MDVPNSAYSEIEQEINKVFEEIDLDKISVANLLGRLKLHPLECFLLMNYKYPNGRGKPCIYKPIVMLKSIIYKELKHIRFREAMIRRFLRHLDEAKDLGYDVNKGIPGPRNFHHFVSTKIDERIRKLMDFVEEKITEKCKENNKIIDIELIEDKKIGDSEKTIKRQKDRKYREVVNFLKWNVFPSINFHRSDNCKYEEIEFLDLLTFVAMRNVCTNQGYNILVETTEEDKNIPRSQTILHHIRNLSEDEIFRMFENANEKIFTLVKKQGRLNGYFDVAIDFTDIMYYGDKNDEMVIETQPKAGTYHAYQFVTLKIVTGNEQYTLMALPVSKFSDKAKLVKRLLEYAKKYIKIRRVYADRWFFKTKFMRLFNEMKITYIMPVVKNYKMKRLLEEKDAPSFFVSTLGEERFNMVVLKSPKDNRKVAFATNGTAIEALYFDMFKLYGQRWDIETGYRVNKHNFFPKTTSKNYKVRMFYFLFSILLYNCWMMVNVVVSIHLFGKILEKKAISSQVFLSAFYMARIEYT
jgi:putative transposase